MKEFEDPITYEEFGARGDGVSDDLPAIRAAHERANAEDRPVRSRPGAAYHLGARALTVEIATDTDWNTSRFTIDDTAVEDHRAPIFRVVSRLEPLPLRLDRLTRDQRHVEARPPRDCFVRVEDARCLRYIRRGPNQHPGMPQQDVFLLRGDGAIEGDIDWDYLDGFTRVEARPLDETPLIIRGGVFTTFANRMRQEVGYNYWARNIVVHRSNTEIRELTHYVVGETDVGHPYYGFISIRHCANVTLRDCFATGHKIYTTIGTAGRPVPMGSYDYTAEGVVNLRLVGCRMNHILDRTRWGVIATNFCKNIRLEDCVLSRMDTHRGVSGAYEIRRCTLGHMGLNAIGRGVLTIEDTTLYGPSLVSLRPDYGSTWDGVVRVRNCRWIPACGERVHPVLIGAHNDGMHDFGYPCRLPREIEIDGLFVDDSNAPADCEGPAVFDDPHRSWEGRDDLPPPPQRPFPYAPCRRVVVRGFRAASGKPLRLAEAPDVEAEFVVIEGT